MVSPIFFIFLLLSVRLISCDALCHVVLEVLVEERVVSPDLINLLSLGRVEASFTLLSFSRSFLPEPIAKIQKSLGRTTLLDEKMNAMQYCNTASERERCQYYSLLPKKAIRFSGSMFLSSSDILS